MGNAYDKAIEAIDVTIIQNTGLSLAEALDAVENVRDHAESWVDALRGDLAAEAAGEE